MSTDTCEVMFDFNVKIKVDLTAIAMSFDNVEIDRNDVRDMLNNALSEYFENMADSVSQTGDWNDTCEVIASTVPEVEVN